MLKFDYTMTCWPLAAALVLALGSGRTLADTMPPEYSTAVAAAEAAGKDLDRAIRGPAAGVESDVAAARAKITDFCDSNYTSVAVKHDSESSIYFIRRSEKAGDLVIGRHYKVTGDAVVPSSVGCMIMAAGPANTVGFAVTHLLGPTPTEFHVFLSLQQDRPIYVATKTAMWSVDHGSIRYVQAAPERNAKGAENVDRPWRATTANKADLDRALEPILLEAHQTYRGARSRFLAGLPPGYRFYVATRLTDASGRFEQVFVRVDRYNGEDAVGHIANDLTLLTNHRSGDPVTVAGGNIVDWVIVDPQGNEEGNVVGKFMDNYKPQP
jgi:uncharacterized protein YegJ (DUF2314 family)